MRTMRLLLLVFLACSIGYGQVQAQTLANLKPGQSWVDFVKTPDDEHVVVWKVPYAARTKTVLKAYLQTHVPSLDTVLWFAETEPKFDIELARLAVTKQPVAALYISYKFPGKDLVVYALKQDKNLFQKADPDLRIHWGMDSMNIEWTPELAEAAYKSNRKFVAMFPATPQYDKYRSGK